MTTKTPIIKYNLKDRGRKFRGVERSFDIKAIASFINSSECQEKVKNRDMLGFYGHWPRLKFGLNPSEGGLDCGKPALVEPALVTTHLTAKNDGTIHHRAEFLDTAAGLVAAKLHLGRVGGFSSAIDIKRPEFFGFDYVLEPNYSTNRGYALDNVANMSADDLNNAILDEQLQGLLLLLDKVQNEQDVARSVIEHLQLENEQLLSVLTNFNAAQNVAKSELAISAHKLDSTADFKQKIKDFSDLSYLPRLQNNDEKSAKIEMPAQYLQLLARL